MVEDYIKSKVRNIKDWPKAGVDFKDITPILLDQEAFRKTIDSIASPYLNQKIDKVVGIDARGFLLAAPLAYKLKAGLAIVRKKGKLPCKCVSRKYLLEYGSNIIEMHEDSIKPGENVLIADDVLATGGTMEAAASLVKQLGGDIVGVHFLVELAFLKGREKLKDYNIKSEIVYE